MFLRLNIGIPSLTSPYSRGWCSPTSSFTSEDSDDVPEEEVTILQETITID